MSQFAQHLTRKLLNKQEGCAKVIYALQTLGHPEALTPHGAGSLPPLGTCPGAGAQTPPQTCWVHDCTSSVPRTSLQLLCGINQTLGRPASPAPSPSPALGLL